MTKFVDFLANFVIFISVGISHLVRYNNNKWIDRCVAVHKSNGLNVERERERKNVTLHFENCNILAKQKDVSRALISKIVVNLQSVSIVIGRPKEKAAEKYRDKSLVKRVRMSWDRCKCEWVFFMQLFNSHDNKTFFFFFVGKQQRLNKNWWRRIATIPTRRRVNAREKRNGRKNHTFRIENIFVAEKNANEQIFEIVSFGDSLFMRNKWSNTWKKKKPPNQTNIIHTHTVIYPHLEHRMIQRKRQKRKERKNKSSTHWIE